MAIFALSGTAHGSPFLVTVVIDAGDNNGVTSQPEPAQSTVAALKGIAKTGAVNWAASCQCPEVAPPTA